MTGARRIAIASALLAAEGSPVSGESLATSLGISRVAVAKHVAALRERGFQIRSTHAIGYELVSVPGLSLPETVAPLVRHPLWKRFEGGEATASTNDDAKRLAAAGADEGTVVVAASQQGGRGRLGRSWESPEGGAYFSAILRPPISPMEVAPLALVVALGVARGLEALGVDVMVKWPNDVLADGRKLVGVLLEMSAEADKVEWVVAGVGINVARPGSGGGGHAYVQDGAPGVGPGVVAASVLDAMAETYARFCESGFGALVDEYSKRDYLRGRKVVARDAVGGIVAAGMAGGVDASGRLLVGDDRVFGGEVTLR